MSDYQLPSAVKAKPRGWVCESEPEPKPLCTVFGCENSATKGLGSSWDVPYHDCRKATEESGRASETSWLGTLFTGIGCAIVAAVYGLMAVVGVLLFLKLVAFAFA